MKRRTRRVILTVLGAVVLVLVAAVVLLPVLLPQERVREMAAARVRAATGGEVVLGDISLKVLPRLRLVLGASSLVLTGDGMRNAGLQPGVLDSARVGLQRLELDLALLPLLKKQLEFGKIRLIGPDVLAVTHPVASADSTGAPEASRAEDQPSPWGLALAGMEVRDGHVVWREAGTPRRAEISGWKQDLSGSDIGLVAARAQRLAGLPPAPGQQPDREGGDATLGLRATVERLVLAGFGERPLPALTDLLLDAEIAIPPTADRALFDVTELSLPGWQVTASGHADRRRVTVTELNLRGGDGAVDVSGNLGVASPPAAGRLRGALSGRVDVAGALQAAQPYLPAPAPDAAPPPAVTGTISLTVIAGDDEAPPLNRADLWQAALAAGTLDTLLVTAESTDLVVVAPQLGEPLRVPGLEYRGDFAGEGLPHHVLARGLAHPIVQGDATLDFAIGRPGTPHQADLRIHRFDLDALTLVVQQQAGVATQARAGWSLVGDAYAAPPGQRAVGEQIPADLQLGFNAVADEVLLLKMPYRNVRLQGSLANRVIDVTSLRAGLGGGDVTGTARVDYAGDPDGVADFTFAAAQVPAQALLQPYAPQLAALWEGKLNLAGQGRCRLGDQAVIRNSLDLTGDIAATDGRIDLSGLLAGIEPYLGGRQDLTRVTYSKYANRIRVETGKVHVSGLVIDGAQTDWTGGGWLGLDGTLDLTVRVKLPPNFVPDLGELAWMAEALKDDQGRVDLGFRLTGQQTSPSVTLDVDTSRLRDKASDEVKEKVREGLGGLLDKLKRK